MTRSCFRSAFREPPTKGSAHLSGSDLLFGPVRSERAKTDQHEDEGKPDDQPVDQTLFTVVQPDCTGDSIAFDRVLILTFSGPIAAADVDAVIQTGIDTPG